MSFGDYVRVLRTYWITIVVATLAGILVGGVATVPITPRYTATAEVLFTPDSGTGDGQDLAFAGSYAQGRMINYQALASSDTVLGPVVSPSSDSNPLGLGLEQTPTQLSEQVSAEFAPTSTTLVISVEDESAATAARIAGSVANSLILQVRILERKTQDETDGAVTTPVSSVNGSLINEPTVPTTRSSPNLQLFLVAGAMFGLLIGLAIALLLFLRRNRKAAAETAAPAAARAPAPQSAPVKQPIAPVSAYQGGTLPQTPPTAQTPLQPASKPQKLKRPGRRPKF